MNGMTKKSSRFISLVIYLITWTLLGLTFAALSYGMGLSEDRRPGVWVTLSTHLARFYIWAALSPLIFSLARRFPIELHSARALLIHGPAIFLISAVHQIVWMSSGWMLSPDISRHFSSYGAFFKGAFIPGLYFNLPVAALLVIAAHAILYYRSYRAGEVQQVLLRSQLAQAQLQALKMQLHPHFLFNTLHSISALVLEDPSKANSMIALLGDFLRQTLEHSDRYTVMLKQEIEFLRCYLDIEQVRFDDRLEVEFFIEPAALCAYVPHMILQPVVENAIRHAIAPSSGPGSIKLNARLLNGTLRLEVKDNGPGLSMRSGLNVSRGVGLKNVRARLSQIYGTRHTFEMRNNDEGGLTVIMVMPFIAQAGAETLQAGGAQ